MNDGTTPSLLQELLRRTFAELGATGPVVRTILICDRYFVGHRFRCGGCQAVLPAGKDSLAFYDEGGMLLKTITIAARGQNDAA